MVMGLGVVREERKRDEVMSHGSEIWIATTATAVDHFICR